MPELVISDEDRQSAEAFLTRFLTDLFPDADFSPGAILRDHTIGAVGAVFALLRAEATATRNATSLRTVERLQNADDFDEAVSNLVSNWLVTRRGGRAVRGTVLIHFSETHDGFVPTSTVFTKTSNIRFALDSDAAVTYQASDLVPRTNAAGEVIDYTLRVPVIAENVGTQYEVGNGPFAGLTRFNRFVLFAENDNPYVGAQDPETSEELLTRLPEAITVRDLNSKRAISAVLKETFSAIDSLTVLGYGDTGMRRDLVQVTPHIDLHLGGHIDVFINTPLLERRVFNGTVGGIYTDPRSEITLFRDETVDDWTAFLVEAGDILRIRNANAGEAGLYIIEEVSKYFLRVNPRQSLPAVRPTLARSGETFTDGAVTGSDTFSSSAAELSAVDIGRYIRITGSGSGNDGDYRILSYDSGADEVTLSVPSGLTVEAGLTFQILIDVVEYSIGDIGPAYDNKVSPATTGEFTRDYQADGQILLPGEPIYFIHEVSLLDLADPDTDPASGRVQFGDRVNTQPDPDPTAPLEYKVENLVPLEGQSAQHMMVCDVGYAPEFEGTEGNISTLNTFFANANVFSPSDAGSGKLVRIKNSFQTGTNGDWRIITYNAPDEVVIENAADPSLFPPTEINLEWELVWDTKYNNKTLRVVYDTLSQFDVINTFVEDDNERVACANTLLRGLHPAYLSFEIRYALRDNANAFFDAEVAKLGLINYINAFPADDTIHVSDIVTAFQSQNSAEVGYVELPITVTYDFYAPDGRLITYETTDAVEISRDKLALPDAIDRLEDPRTLGVVDPNVRYLSSIDLITLTQVS